MQNLVSISITNSTDGEVSDVDAVIFVTKKSCAIIVFIEADTKRLRWRRHE